MKLHNNNETFNRLIKIVGDYYKIDPAFIEKDYFVSLVLKKLNELVPHLIFKGGTSLSKCYKIINRFSEDIDLTLGKGYHTQGQKRHMKFSIVNVCNDLELHLLNAEETRSRRDYNCYKIEYPYQHISSSVKPILLVETSYITEAYPCELRLVTSIIYDYFYEIGNEEAIKKYELEPFDIYVQTVERTLVDKVFAICDYALSNRLERNSRHIYDISQLLAKVKLDDNLKKIIKEVRSDRKIHELCYSAQDGVNVSEILSEIVKLDIFKKDYENVTKLMMYKQLPYEKAIKSIEIISNSRIFDE